MAPTSSTMGSTGLTPEQGAALVGIAEDVERQAAQKSLGLKGKGSSTVKALCKQMGRKNASPKTLQEAAQGLVASLSKGNEQAKALVQKIKNALAGASAGTPQASTAPAGDDTLLIALANEILAQAAILALAGDGQNQAKALCGEMLNPARAKPIREYADQLAVMLKNGSAVAQKFAAQLVDILQLKLLLPVAATVPVPTESELDTPALPTDGGNVAGVGDGATESDAAEGSEKPLYKIVWVEPKELREDPKFSRLFERDQKIVDAITQSLKEDEFEVEHPVVATPDGRIVDGTTRWLASIAAEVAYIPVVYLEFENDEEAIEYAERAQLVRRNLDNSALLRLVEHHDQRRARGGDRRSAEAINASKAAIGRSSQETADKIGVSSSTVEKARAILDSGDVELRKQVESGVVSIDAGSKTARAQKKAVKKGPDQLRRESGVKMLRNLQAASAVGRKHWSVETALVDDIVTALQVRVAAIPTAKPIKKPAKQATKVGKAKKGGNHA